MKTNQLIDRNKKEITLDLSVWYQITIAGILSESFTDWVDSVRIDQNVEASGEVTTSITGKFDQASLHGLLRRLYQLAYRLVSVWRLNTREEKEEHE